MKALCAESIQFMVNAKNNDDARRKIFKLARVIPVMFNSITMQNMHGIPSK